LQKLAAPGTFLLFPVDRRASGSLEESSKENTATFSRRTRDLSELARLVVGPSAYGAFLVSPKALAQYSL
jgi:hypothetical protein